jgi:hypothetical protein
MAIAFRCPSCAAALEMPEQAAGTKMNCPRCTAQVVVPTEEAIPVVKALRPPKKTGGWIIALVVCLCLALLCCIPATLIGLLVPAIQQVREAAARTQTMNNMQICGRAVQISNDINKKIPPYYGSYPPKTNSYSFHTHLLQFVNQLPLYNQEPPNPQGLVPVYVSTLDSTLTNNGAGAANFPVNIRLFYTNGGTGALGTEGQLIYPKLQESFPDGLSNTLLFATKYHHCGAGGSFWADNNAPTSISSATFGSSMALWQVAPTQAACNPSAGTAVSFTSQTIQVVMCDGSVRSVAVGISPTTWQAVHTPGAGDAVGADWNN